MYETAQTPHISLQSWQPEGEQCHANTQKTAVSLKIVPENTLGSSVPDKPLLTRNTQPVNQNTQPNQARLDQAKFLLCPKTVRFIETLDEASQSVVEKMLLNMLEISELTIPEEVVTTEELESVTHVPLCTFIEQSHPPSPDFQVGVIRVFWGLHEILNRQGIYEVFSVKTGKSLARIVTSLNNHYRFMEICAGKGLLSASIKAAGCSVPIEVTDLVPPPKAFPGVAVKQCDATKLIETHPCSTVFLVSQPPERVWMELLSAQIPRIYLQAGNSYDPEIHSISGLKSLHFINLNVDNYRRITASAMVRFLIKGSPEHYQKILNSLPEDLVGTHGEWPPKPSTL